MKIATWNVNSVRKRADALGAWLARTAPDIVLLQELKCVEAQFPRLELEAAGWRVEMVGQKTFNGVAILSRRKLEIVERALPGDPDDVQARWLEARAETASGRALRVASIYLPNGNPAPGEKFDYKLGFMRRLKERAAALLATEDFVVLGGDWNVCPTDADVHDPAGFAADALCRPESRAAFRAILNLGYTEAWRALHPDETGWTYWDYQAGAWQKDHGLRIDHLLLSPQAADRLRACGIDRSERGKPEPSDHVPIWVDLDIDPPTD